MTEIFISNAGADRERVKVLADSLREWGHSVWWDGDIPPGATFDDFIEEKLRLAHCIVVVWSKASTTSRWVRAEASEGVTRNNLVPVLIENVKIPLAFRNIQAADLTDWTGQENHEALQSLFRQVDILISAKNADKVSHESRSGNKSAGRKDKNQREIRVHLKVNRIMYDGPRQYVLRIDGQTVWQGSVISHEGLIYRGHVPNGLHGISSITSSNGGFTTTKSIDFDSDKSIRIRVKKSWWDGRQSVEFH